jgi:hypothetical protein
MRFRAEIERGMGRLIIGPLLSNLDGYMGLVYEEAFRD